VLTARDVLAVRWLAEQYAATTDTLAVLLGRLSPATPEAPGQVAARTVRHHLDRWVRAGLVTRTRRLGRAWVTPTRRGLDLVELDYPVWALPATQLAHVHAVGLVRLALEPDPGAGGWISERALFRERGQASWHLADGALPVPVPAGWVAQGIEDAFWRIEVELTPKPRRRLAAALRTQAPRTARVSYYAPPGHLDRLTGELAGLRRELRCPFALDVLPLPDVPGAAYGGLA